MNFIVDFIKDKLFSKIGKFLIAFVYSIVFLKCIIEFILCLKLLLSIVGFILKVKLLLLTIS